jgi:Uma2 family endonuclease
MANTLHQTMTADEFLIWCLDQDERYELIDGIAVPLRGMAGASRSHDRVVVNLISALTGSSATARACRRPQTRRCGPQSSGSAVPT